MSSPRPASPARAAGSRPVSAYPDQRRGAATHSSTRESLHDWSAIRRFRQFCRPPAAGADDPRAALRTSRPRQQGPARRHRGRVRVLALWQSSAEAREPAEQALAVVVIAHGSESLPGRRAERPAGALRTRSEVDLADIATGGQGLERAHRLAEPRLVARRGLALVPDRVDGDVEPARHGERRWSGSDERRLL